MKFLRKQHDARFSEMVYGNWRVNQRIRALLLEEQYGFCAYTEKFISPLAACAVEHFDDRKKNTSDDGYRNWYAVLTQVNERKISIKKYLPILQPDSDELSERVIYRNGAFVPAREEDVEAQHLIDFIGIERPEVVEERELHLSRVQFLRQHSDDDAMFRELLLGDRSTLSFASMLEQELAIDVMALLFVLGVHGMNLHHLAEARSLELHREIARRLRSDPELIGRVRQRVNQWRDEGTVHPTYAQQWAQQLAQPLERLLAFLLEDSPGARAMRQVTPFAGIVDPEDEVADLATGALRRGELEPTPMNRAQLGHDLEPLGASNRRDT